VLVPLFTAVATMAVAEGEFMACIVSIEIDPNAKI